MSSPIVSILIPTCEGESDLERLLPVLESQELEGGFEIRAIDSDSRDTTRQLLRRHGIDVCRIERSDFGHGKTRNELARQAAGEFLAFLSQDATPRGTDYLAHLIEPFSDPEVAGVQARILPYPDQDPLTTRTALALPEAGESLPEGEAGGIVFNNVASAVRSSDLAALPFPDVPFGEDWAWASAALAAGRRIRFAPHAVAYHAHRYEPAGVFRRYRTDARFRREVLGEQVRPDLRSVLKGIAFELRADLRYVRASGAPLAELLRAPRLRAAQVLGQLAGSRGWPARGGEDFSGDAYDKLSRRVGRAQSRESTVSPGSSR